jgi:hypothetical protein
MARSSALAIVLTFTSDRRRELIVVVSLNEYAAVADE